MGLFDFLKKKEFNPRIFSSLTSHSAPIMKGEDYLRAYKGWVYTCVKAIADEVGTLDLILQTRKNDQWQDVDQHIILDLLNNVNGFNTFSDLLKGTESYLDLVGDAFWYLPKGDKTNKPIEIWLLNPIKITIVKSAEKIIGGYIFHNERGDKIPLETSEVIRFAEFNPTSRFNGLGALQAAAVAVDVDRYSAEWNKNFFFNAAIPSAVLETEEDLTDEQFERLKQEWNDRYTSLDNAHKLAILQAGLKYKPAQLSQKDMEFLEQRRFSRDEILAIFRVPKTILGITEDVNRANAEASEYVFAKRVVQPKMQFITERLNEFLLPMFGLDDRFWRFDFESPVPQNRELELKENETGLRAGYMTINEVRGNEGLDPITNGDQVFIPFNLYPVGGTETKSVVKVTKQTQDEKHREFVNKRVRFLVTEIKKQSPEFKRVLDKIIRQIAERIADFTKAINKDAVDDLISLIYETEDGDLLIVKEQTFRTLQRSFVKGGTASMGTLGVDNPFNATNERAVEWLDQHALETAKSVNGTIKERAAEIIREGVRDGFSNKEISDFIVELTDEVTPANAERIARTEVVRGYAEGSLEAYRQSGVVIGKTWLTAGDDRVEEDCLMNEDDGAIPLNASFSSGNSAPPEHPNCRCVLVPYTGNELELTMFDKLEARIKEELDRVSITIDKQLREGRQEAKDEATGILTEAKKEAKKIVSESVKEAKLEKKAILKDLTKIREEALETKYGKEE